MAVLIPKRTRSIKKPAITPKRLSIKRMDSGYTRAPVSYFEFVKVSFSVRCCSGQEADQADRVDRLVSVDAVEEPGATHTFGIRHGEPSRIVMNDPRVYTQVAGDDYTPFCATAIFVRGGPCARLTHETHAEESNRNGSMARLARVIAVGVPHHITQRGNARRFILQDKTDRKVYLDLLRHSTELTTAFA
jgi:hypothetical protein